MISRENHNLEPTTIRYDVGHPVYFFSIDKIGCFLRKGISAFINKIYLKI